MEVEKACEIIGSPLRTAYEWIKQWNKEEYEGTNQT